MNTMIYKTDDVSLLPMNERGESFFECWVYRDEWEDSVQVEVPFMDIIDEVQIPDGFKFPLYVGGDKWMQKHFIWDNELSPSEQNSIAEKVINAKYQPGDIDPAKEAKKAYSEYIDEQMNNTFSQLGKTA